MSKHKEKFNLAKTTAAVLILLVAGIFSSQFNTEKKTFSARAEYDGTFCNDDIGDTLNSSGSTSFLINCWGKLNRKFTYVLFWCPEKSKGATYCGDLRDIDSQQSQVIDRAEGSSLTSYMRKSTDKTCGCVQWDVGVGGATGQEGVAGGAIMCAPQPCNQNPTSAPNPTAAQPTSPPATTAPVSTNTPTPQSCYSGQTRCQDGRCVEFQDECGATSTPTRTPTIKTCPNNRYLCPGTTLCVSAQAECEPTSTPTRTPTPTLRTSPTATPTTAAGGTIDPNCVVTLQTPGEGDEVGRSSMTFKWSACSGISQYRINFFGPGVDAGWTDIPSTSYTPDLNHSRNAFQDGKSYRWSVTPCISGCNPGTGKSSASRNFIYKTAAVPTFGAATAAKPSPVPTPRVIQVDTTMYMYACNQNKKFDCVQL
jgi:hypothetical protein